MKNITISQHCLVFMGIALILTTSCNFLGLPLQEDYVFNTNVPDPDLHTTAMGFIESRKDKDMTLMYDAIKLLRIEDKYETENRTYLLMSNTCFTSWLKLYNVTAVEDMNKTDLRDLLLGQIGIGLYSSYNLTTTPQRIETENTDVIFYLNIRPAASTDPDKYSIRVNNVPESSKYISISTSNLVADNGYVHVIDFTYAILYK